jgi:hypothetical protein
MERGSWQGLTAITIALIPPGTSALSSRPNWADRASTSFSFILLGTIAGARAGYSAARSLCSKRIPAARQALAATGSRCSAYGGYVHTRPRVAEYPVPSAGGGLEGDYALAIVLAEQALEA